jgi:hypothetical protein
LIGYEQSVVAHAMAYSTKIGPYLEEDDKPEVDAANSFYLYPILIFMSILSLFLLK